MREAEELELARATDEGEPTAGRLVFDLLELPYLGRPEALEIERSECAECRDVLGRGVRNRTDQNLAGLGLTRSITASPVSMPIRTLKATSAPARRRAHSRAASAARSARAGSSSCPTGAPKSA